MDEENEPEIGDDNSPQDGSPPEEVEETKGELEGEPAQELEVPTEDAAEDGNLNGQEKEQNKSEHNGESGPTHEPVTNGNEVVENGETPDLEQKVDDAEPQLDHQSEHPAEDDEEKIGEGDRQKSYHEAEGEGEAKPAKEEDKKVDDDIFEGQPEAEGEGDMNQEDQYEKAAKDPRVTWIITKIEDYLDDFKLDSMWRPEYYSWITDFLNLKLDIAKLYAWVNLKDKDIYFTNTGNPSIDCKIEQFQMVYFVRLKFDEPVTMGNIEKIIHVDSVEGDPLDDLLNKMNAEYLNQFLSDKTWPEGVRKDFIAGLHRFMAALTEASHISKGRTTLYIPQEDLSDFEAAAKDKDLLQRLESTVIFWTRQIKEVVSNQESQQSNENLSSPLDEIEHWATRTNNLDVLNKQLQKPELQNI